MLTYNDSVDIHRPVLIEQVEDLCIGRFDAMASPCEILIETQDLTLAQQLTEIAAKETWRIEQKYSRYREDGIVPAINNSNGYPVSVDDETAMLIDFAYQCYEMSNGLFDITSGVLRRIWKFDGSNKLAKQPAIDKLLPFIGLDKVSWEKPQFTLKAGMEIDLGGIGKEYAVDRVLQLLVETTTPLNTSPNTMPNKLPVLVNFGGDIAATARTDGKHWRVGIEAKDKCDIAENVVNFLQGGIATSGDAKRVIIQGNKRYGHILNPKTGWPIANAPRAITVLANTCTEAGILSTLAMLQGAKAEALLDKEGIQYWIQR